MPFLKQTFMWIFFLTAMYLGGSSTQSSSNMLQGVGFVSIVMALVCLYIIFKLMWRSRGTITTVSVVLGVVLYSAYAIGLFDGKTLSSFRTGTPVVQSAAPIDSNQEQQKQQDMNVLDAELFGGDYTSPSDGSSPETSLPSEGETKASEEYGSRTESVNNKGLVGKIKTMLFGEEEAQPNAQPAIKVGLNPFDYPSISGRARVITGSVLLINGLHVKMYGIDAPDITQTCANHFGTGYYCGRESRTWLQNWISNREVTCHILGDVQKGWATGVCFVDDNRYDVAAVVVNAGWAVAFTQNTDVYVEYEQQARTNRRGLWAGTFYKPWDWRRIQNRKVEITVKHTAPTPSPSSSKGFDFWGLF